jgi:hypothetical protein
MYKTAAKQICFRLGYDKGLAIGDLTGASVSGTPWDDSSGDPFTTINKTTRERKNYSDTFKSTSWEVAQ